MKSRIYKGSVMHSRGTPVQHRWEFPFYFYGIDLDELEQLDRTVRGFGYNRWMMVSICEDDYLRGTGSIRERLAEVVGMAEVDRIILITVARFMTKVFNPVSFYYCLRTDGTAVNMVAEVNNTFGERHLYVLEGGDSFPLVRQHDKQFHVSPFNNMNGFYEFSFSKPEDELKITIKLHRDGKVVMVAALQGNGVPLTTSNLWKTVLIHPLTAAMTVPRILWQAAILYYKKKLTVFKHPDPSSLMTIKVKS